ncbi:mechanosensitive ion channel [Alsobacter sp. SYSU M60028]|uniref:Mechanosensitive ion channel n=1 Tax=Alsobacter ponti TaxID=2962936 RepID=A0ABT1LFK2_9HYPH|nr:mechanosensitive ion channel domain-containing protein [Alsobacter ponti]MCP8940219.1 mechanosensitive ion channel [Alsobacter ponti]
MMLRSLVATLGLVLALWLGAGPALAQTAAPPAGMSREQFDQLVNSISEAVAQKLREEGKAVPQAPAQPPVAARPAEAEAADPMAQQVGDFVSRAQRVLSALPAFWANLARIPDELAVDARRGPFAYLILLALACVAAVGAEAATRRVFASTRARLAAASAPSNGPRGLMSLAGLAALDVLGLAAVWLVSYGAIGAWFNGVEPQSRVASGVLAALFGWRLYLFAFRVVLRPGEAGARLASVSDDEAALGMRLVSRVILAVVALRVVLRMLIAIHAPSEAISAGQLVVNLVLLLVFVAVSRRGRDVGAHWFGGLAAPGSFGAWLGARWLMLAVPFWTLLVGTQVFGAISARFAVPSAMLLTLNIVIALLVFETLLKAVLERLRPAALASEEAAADGALPGVTHVAPPLAMDVVARSLRVLVVIFAALAVAQSWVVNVIGLFDASQWRELTRASVRAGATLFVAYVAWELVKLVTGRYVARHQVGMPTDEDRAADSGASRLATLMPLMRVALAVVIGVLAVLIVLSEMGVNVTPLIAGASVFGLAISFGSQTLVRDIVSGVFYLTDDAFRIGEYIDCGKAKGTVEGFTLRSLKLRHQNGQVHTIPFGQLGQITNFSRDWTTVKFNLRFARETDVEKLRKATKKIGQDMLEDPEIKPEILEPLKMQGVADIADQALVVRFKFTVRPGKPSFIQRNAIKRMVATFPALGIEFASATVAVSTSGGAVDPHAAGAAATVARLQAEAAQNAGAAAG